MQIYQCLFFKYDLVLRNPHPLIFQFDNSLRKQFKKSATRKYSHNFRSFTISHINKICHTAVRVL